MTEPVTIVLLGQPVAWARAGSKGGQRYTPAKQRNNFATIQQAAERGMNGRTMIDQAVNLVISAEFQIPKSWSKKKQQAALRGEVRPTGTPDGSNVQKQVEDAFNGVVWRDDSLVVGWCGVKRYASQPKLVITVTPIDHPPTHLAPAPPV